MWRGPLFPVLFIFVGGREETVGDIFSLTRHVFSVFSGLYFVFCFFFNRDDIVRHLPHWWHRFLCRRNSCLYFTVSSVLVGFFSFAPLALRIYEWYALMRKRFSLEAEALLDACYARGITIFFRESILKEPYTRPKNDIRDKLWSIPWPRYSLWSSKTRMALRSIFDVFL